MTMAVAIATSGWRNASDARAALWRAFDERAKREEDPYIAAALAQFAFEQRDIDEILRRYAAGDPYITAAVNRILANYNPGGDYHAQWLGRYTKLIGHTVNVGAENQKATVGFDFTLSNPRVQSIIRQRAAELVKNVTETTKASIRAAVESGRSEGLGTREIAERIHETTFGEITKTRAQTIARTETVGALNAGEYQAALDSGVMRSKTWVTQGDDRVRDTHRALDGVTIDLTAAFANGLRYPHAPGAPAKEVVNCRCTLLFSHEEAHAARS